MDNLKLYEQARSVPDDAKKPILGGKLKGFSNINPMYRIKRLTELFGPCGDGWWYEVTDQRLQPVGDGQVICFVDVNLYYKLADGTESRPIFGCGGNSFISTTKGGLQVSDECFKMALTDAISVAAKALGVGADVYWQEDSTKYGSFGGNGYVQPEVYVQQEAPSYQTAPAQPAYAPQAAYTGQPQQAVPSMITVDQAKNVLCSVGYNSGKTLGDIAQGNNCMKDLEFISRFAANDIEKTAAMILRQSMLM